MVLQRSISPNTTLRTQIKYFHLKFRSKIVSAEVLHDVVFSSLLSLPVFLDLTFTLAASTLYHESILGHSSRLVAEINNPPNVRRRLRRQWPSDLPQPADEEG
jgi:hypothetical protein